MAVNRVNINDATGEVCLLCGNAHVLHLLFEADKTYYACGVCGLRFLSPHAFLSREEEFAHYQTHQNALDDLGYRRFLSKIVSPLLEKLAPSSSGLDYGCGPAPLLAQMMLDAGHEMAVYDPFYHPDKAVFSRNYDFITCTEVAEHFYAPWSEFEKLCALLKPGGWLAVMTCFQTDDTKFATWQYRQDPTHVVFYKEETFSWLSAKLGLSLEIPAKDVVLMRKPAQVPPTC